MAPRKNHGRIGEKRGLTALYEWVEQRNNLFNLKNGCME
jgi:hypothetical protein